jgi:hypothetical protein
MTESQVGRHQVGRHHEVTVACSPPSSRTSSSIRLLQEHHLRLPRPQVQGHRPQGVVRDAVNGVAVKPTGKTFALNIGALPCAPKATPTPYPADRADAPHLRQDDAHHLLRRPHHHHRLRARLGDLPMPIVRKPLYIMRNRIRAGGQARPDL